MSVKNVIEKKDWVSNFTLIGVPKINADYTFKINEKSEKSNWVYNSLNLGIDCGEKFGTVYAEMMGGYSEDGNSVIYAHGKKDDGTDDFENRITVDWDDRLNESILEEIGDFCFISVGLEKTDKGKTFVKKFLSAYDAIVYIKEHLTEDMVVNVKGNLKYSTYQGKTQVRKNITSIVLSKVDDASKYVARFTQSILIDKYSASLKNIDKDKGVMFVDAKVLDYVKEIDGVEIKGQYPFDKTFEFEMDFTNQEVCKKVMSKMFNVKKGYTQVTFEGELIEGGAVVTATIDDIPQDIKDLIEIGVYTEEQALARCSVNAPREQRMVIKAPLIRLVGDDDKKVPVVQRFEERYTEEDLVFDLSEDEVETDDVDTENTESSDISGDNMSWLDMVD